jgi:hypothetical protein
MSATTAKLGYASAYQICMVIKLLKSAVFAAALQAARVPFAIVWLLGALPGLHATVGDIVVFNLFCELVKI